MPQTYNENIEMSVLSCLFKNGSLFSVVEDFLEKRSFGWQPFGIIFQSIKEVNSNNILPDVMTIYTDLDKKGMIDTIKIMSNGLQGKAALEYIANFDVNPDNIESYARQVQELYATRQLMALLDKEKQAIEGGSSPIEILSHLDLETGKIAAYVGAQSKNIKSAKDVGHESVEQFQEAAHGNDLYISTGINAWDDFTNGLYPGRLYIVAAASNDGKSSLIQNIVYNISVERKIKSFLLTLEASSVEVYNKIIQRMTGISSMIIEKGHLKDAELEKYTEAVGKIANSEIIFDDSPELILPLLRTKIRKAVANGARVILIDQLEQILIGFGGEVQAEYVRINYIAYRIKAFAREMQVPIILVHQMNRSADSGQNRGKNVDPQIQDLSQAGERPADSVLIIRHKKEGQKILETYFHWVKNRQGKKGRRRVEFDGEHVLFRDLEGFSEFPDYAQEEITYFD